MPKSRGRTIRNATSKSALGPGDRAFEARLRAVEEQTYEIAKGIAEFVNEVNRDFDALLDQQAECNLRLMYLMSQKIRKTTPSPIVGGEPTVVVTTVYDLYMEQRDAFQATLKEQIRHEREQQTADAPPTSDGTIGQIKLTDRDAPIPFARGPKAAQ